jgi:ATP-dependent DNA ligase
MSIMQLPVMPPVQPMLAKSVASVPTGEYGYEPKWDGFRCVVFRDGDEVELGSRNERPLTRYFPELVTAVREHLPARCVLDGEIVIPTGEHLDFEALLQRIHPADSRVQLLAEQTPAHFVAFDLLAVGDENLTGHPFADRRSQLEAMLGGVQPDARIHLTPFTRDVATAERWFTEFEGAGLDGVIAKSLTGPYRPNIRAMFKVKHVRSADCVVAGYRLHATSTDEQPRVGSLLLGLYNEAGVLQHVGVIGAFTAKRRAELIAELLPWQLAPDEPHPWHEYAGTDDTNRRPGAVSRWNAGKDLSFVPLRPDRVVEVKYDHLEGTRFRHTAQFLRWRDDRDPQSCSYHQLDEPVSYDLAEVLSGGR